MEIDIGRLDVDTVVDDVVRASAPRRTAVSTLIYLIALTRAKFVWVCVRAAKKKRDERQMHTTPHLKLATCYC